MDALLAAVTALLHWRVLISTALGVLVGVSLARGIAWFPGIAGGAVILLALSFGLLWESRAEAGIPLRQAMPPASVRPSVAALGFLVIGVFWGAVIGSLTGSLATAAILLAALPSVFGALRSHFRHDPMPWRFVALATGSLLAGVAALAVLGTSYASKPSNPSIERTAAGKPSSAAHVQR